MRLCLLVLGLICTFVVVTQARADEAADARAQVEKAVQAHGGANALAKMQRMVRTSSGSMFLFGQPSPFRDELTVSLPSKWRLDLATTANGQQNRMQLIVNENDSWQGNSLGMNLSPKERTAELQNESRVMWFATLVPLLQDKALQLAPIPGAPVDMRPTQGISVTQTGKPEIRLYFDAQSNLLVKIARKTREGGLEIEKEYFYANHQPVQGVMMPAKYVEFSSGRKFVEVNSINYKFLDSVDDKLFAKP